MSIFRGHDTAVYSVSQVTAYLKEVLAQDPVLQDVWVRGEVSDLRRPGSGHSYFNLRDPNGMLGCALFRRPYGSRLVSNGAELLSEGVAVLAHGRVGIYEVRGDLQLVVDVVRPEGVGELQLKLEELKLRLEAEGLFETSRKRPMPPFPTRIAVATSPDGAVWHDIRNVIERRYPLVELLLAPTPVQGDSAAQGIVEALKAADQVEDLDLVIVARGGGSLEDLWPFNEEAVARAIFASRAPVVSAVGHETDITIADLVADRRAPTPSAAAEMAVPDQRELGGGLIGSQQAMHAGMLRQVGFGKDTLSRLGPRLDRGRPDLDGLRQRIDDMLDTAGRHLRRDVGVKLERTEAFRLRLESLSPRDTLRRGYAIVQARTDEATVVSQSSQVDVGDAVRVTLARGGFEAGVTKIRSHGD